jgi:streptogrisin C
MWKVGGNVRRKLVRASITTIALTTVASSTVAGSSGALAAPVAPSADPDPAVSGESDLAAKDLAARRGITLADAQQRISWQARAPQLGQAVAKSLGARFGGVWIDAKSDRVKVGTVGDAAAAVRTAAANAGLAAATDAVLVRFSWTELADHNSWLGAQIAGVNTKDANVMLSAGIRTDINAVQLVVPAEGQLTAAQQALVEEAKRKIGPALTVVTHGTGRAETQSCSLSDCDPPLRGGVRIWNSVSGGRVGCTTGFTGQDANGTLFMFTAGHCVRTADTQDNWTAEFADGSTHVVGPRANSVFGPQGDAAVLKVTNPGGWKLPSATVLVGGGPNIDRNENYKIASTGGFKVNQTVCVSGATTVKTMCGTVTSVDETVTYPREGVTVKGLAFSTACTSPGDSGGAVFAANTALGLVSGGFDGQCKSILQPIQGAEKLMGVSVLHA